MKDYSKEIIDFPTRDVWGEFYSKFREPLLEKLSSYYCFADREDAVEAAFDKLMNKKKKASYGDKMPKTEEDWFWALYWQAKSYLSHMSAHGVVHSKYVHEMSKELENVFGPACTGKALDYVVYSKALSLTLDSFRRNLNISCRNFKIYLCSVYKKIPAKVIAKKFGISEENVYVIKFRIGKLLEKHGKKYFQAALKKAA